MSARHVQPDARVKRLALTLDRLAIDVADTIDAIARGPISDRDTLALASAEALLPQSVDRLEQIAYEAEQAGQFDGIQRRPPLPLTEAGAS